MRIASVFAYMWYWPAGLLTRGFKAVVVCVLGIALALLTFVLAAQLTRYGRTGEWHPVPNAELLDILKIDVASLEGEAFGFLLERPTTLTLLCVALACLLLAKVMSVLERKRKAHHPAGAHRQAMITDIEQALARHADEPSREPALGPSLGDPPRSRTD